LKYVVVTGSAEVVIRDEAEQMTKNAKLILLSKFYFLLGVTLIILGLFGAAGAQAAVRTWTGTSSNLWSVGGSGNNWDGDAAPVNGDTIQYANNSAQYLTTQSNDISNLDLRGISMASGLLSPVTISGNSFTLSGSISNLSNQNLTIKNNLTLSSGMGISSWNVSQVTIVGNIDNAGHPFNFWGYNAGSTLNLSGIISGSGLFNFASNSNATCNIQAAQIYTGLTRIMGTATLRLSGAGSLPDNSYVLLNNNTSTFDLNGVSDTVGSLAGTGSVVLGGATLTMGGDNTSTNISGVISETGNLVKEGTGRLFLSGNNTYIGSTSINNGSVNVSGSERVPDNSAVTINAGSFRLGGGNETIGSLSGAVGTTVYLGGNSTLTTGGDNTNTTFAGVISLTGNVTKTGNGNFSLTGNNTYTGTTTVNGGILLIHGTMSSASYVLGAELSLGASERLPDNSTVTLATTGIFNLASNNESIGTLTGTGTVNGNPGVLTVFTNLSPGASPGIIHTGNLVIANSASLDIEIDGINPGSGYDQIDVNGTVDITGSTLNLIFGYSPNLGDAFIIIDNDAADSVIGTFNNLSEGTTFSSGGYNLQITYVGGDGNDIVITIVPAAPIATTATNASLTAFTANWNASSGATGYYLDVATDAGFSNFGSGGFQNLDVGNVTTYNVTSLTGSTYYYRVRASSASLQRKLGQRKFKHHHSTSSESRHTYA